MEQLDIALQGVTAGYGGTPALHDLSVTFPAGRITGLLGRNGAGKTTLMALLAGLRRTMAGTVRLGGEDPFDHPVRMRQVAFVGSGGGDDDGARISGRLDFVAALRPGFDRPFADALIDRFELSDRARVRQLSKGQRAAVAVSIGLAARVASSPTAATRRSFMTLSVSARKAPVTIGLRMKLRATRSR